MLAAQEGERQERFGAPECHNADMAVPSRFADFLALTKPRLNFLVLLTTAAAYRLGLDGPLAPGPFIHTLMGTALVAGGAAALN